MRAPNLKTRLLCWPTRYAQRLHNTSWNMPYNLSKYNPHTFYCNELWCVLLYIVFVCVLTLQSAVWLHVIGGLLKKKSTSCSAVNVTPVAEECRWKLNEEEIDRRKDGKTDRQKKHQKNPDKHVNAQEKTYSYLRNSPKLKPTGGLLRRVHTSISF